MLPRLLVLAGLGAALLVVPTAASAATVAPTRACYPDVGSDSRAALVLNGFAPGATLSISVDGTAPVTTVADATGAAQGSLPVPGLPSGVNEQSHTVTVNDGATSATAAFSTSRFHGDFTPSSGNPATLKVSFSAFGMNMFKPSTVYVHYVKPNGKLKKTISLGKAHGACGHITSSKKRKLFGFKAERGTWLLQYDTSKTYRKATKKTTYAWASVSVKIKRINRR